MSSPLRNIALKPFSALWESVYKMRRAFYEYGILKKDYFKVPIISIGNNFIMDVMKKPISSTYLKRPGSI